MLAGFELAPFNAYNQAMKPESSKFPWYFHPGWFWAILFLSFIVQVSTYYADKSVFETILTAVGLTIAAFYFSWSFLLYEYLAPSTLDSSRHWSGRNKVPIVIILGSLLLLIPMSELGINTKKPNELADLMVFPVFISFFLLNWRACDLLVSLERDAGRGRSVTISFIAMFYLPLTIWWFYHRLKALRANGRI